MNYGEVLSSAWKTIWKYKVLWIFGILAALGSGGGGGGGGGGNSNVNFGNGDRPQFFNPNWPEWAQVFGNWIEQNIWLVLIAVALITFLIIVVVLVLSTYGRIGLARGAWKADEGAPRLTFGMLFAESGRFFWRVLGLAFLMFILGFGVGIIILVMTLGVTVLTLGIGLLCLIPFFCVLVVAGWVVEIIVRLAVISIVGDDVDIFEGLRRGWNTVRTYLGQSVVMGLILGIGGWFVRLIIGLPFILALIPFIPAFFTGTQQAIERGVIGAVVVVCVYLPFAVVLGGILEAYVGTAWTLTYRRLTGHSRQAVEVA